jgi:hypothetical protein
VKDDFVVRPRTAGGWDQIVGALARLFERLQATGEPHCVIIELEAARYVQFIVRPDGSMWAESVGEVFLDDGDEFDDEQHRTLAQLGWNPPELFGRGKGNYWREYDDGCFLEAASIAALTIVDVFGGEPHESIYVGIFEALALRG